MTHPMLSLDSLLRFMRECYLPLRDRRHAETAPDILCEHTEPGGRCQFGERFLQILWNEQRLSTSLHTCDGRALEVVSPGTWNVSAGADFSNAVVRLDGVLWRGAVEVHREEADWFRHGHHLDPAYSSVVLHVVWRRGGGEGPAGLPCLELSPHLCDPLRDLMADLDNAVYPYARKVAPGACAVRWAMTDDATVRRLLRAAALARFEDKTLRLQRRVVAVGADQALYEAVFEALGYAANREAFRALARALTLEKLQAQADDQGREAALFGAAGLLPDPSTAAILPEWRPVVRGLWDRWWGDGGHRLPLGWRRSGTRPLNSPERRLAAGVAWLAACGHCPAAWLAGRAAQAGDGVRLIRDLRRHLSVRSPWDPIQDCTRRLPRPASLVGRNRADDIIVNTLLPFLNAAGSHGGDETLCRLAREAYLAAAPLQPNRLLMEATHRFLVPPSRARDLVRAAADQQGLLELYRCFCLAGPAGCQGCPFAGSTPFDDAHSSNTV